MGTLGHFIRCRGQWLGQAPRPTRVRGQATVEFAFAGTAFFLIIFGTLDFGRVIYTYVQLHNAVREGARYAKVHCDESGWVSDTEDAVIEHSPTLGLVRDDIDVDLDDECAPLDNQIEVEAETEFTAVTQAFLGIGPIDLEASATVDVE